MTKSTEVVQRFVDRGMHLTPGALKMVNNRTDLSVDSLISDLEKRANKPSIVTDGMISRLLDSGFEYASDNSEIGSESEDSSVDESPGEADERLPVVEGDYSTEREEEDDSRSMTEKDLEGKVRILKDITGESTSEGEIEDFIQLFRDRYEKLSSIIKSREGFKNYTELKNIVRHEGDDVNLVGIVNTIRETRKKDAWIAELEDLTGRAVVYVKDSQRNEKAVEAIKKVITDEVIGVKARVPDDLRTGGRIPLIWGNEIFWPDIPVSRSVSPSGDRSKDPSGKAVLISDLHVGSSMFMPDIFDRFLKWLNGVAGNDRQKELASEVKYIIIAGDLVDGIGIYPGQQEELEIENIQDQYTRVAELLSKVPDDVHIIASPGNHDAVRLAEPQPALGPEVASPLEKIGVQLVGNPVFLELEKVTFLVYHGMSFGDLASITSSLDREDPALLMEELLRRRHLAPIYGEPMGGKAPISPEKEDYMVISEVPDVFHCGHIHRYGCSEYRGVLMVNSATFQEQTAFMKRQGIVPTPGRVPIVDLDSKRARTINFA